MFSQLKQDSPTNITTTDTPSLVHKIQGHKLKWKH